MQPSAKLKLQRVDYVQVASLKCSNSIQLLSAKGVKHQQKVVVGDQRGILQLISIKKGEPFVDFKVELKSPVNCVTVHVNSNEPTKEMIITATQQTVQGFSAKGKLIFKMDTNLVEPIQHLWMASKEELVVSNSYVYNHYQDGKEANYFLSTDRINAVAVLPLNKVPSLTPLLGCQDGNIYSLRDSSVRHRLPIDAGIPTAIQLFQNDGGTSGEWVIYGTSLGQIGLVRWSRAGPAVRWVIQLPSQTTVTSLDFYDVSDSDDGGQLIIGREDGVVEVYQVPPEDDAVHSPTLIFSQNCNDSIAAVRGGIIGADGFPEILVATQRGWIFGLTSCESTTRRKQPDEVTAARASNAHGSERRKQLQYLKSEVEFLEKQFTEAKNNKSPALLPASLEKTETTSAQVNQNAYYISVESQVSINFILVQCDTNVQLMDVERNLAILSVVDHEKNGPSRLTATFRCQPTQSTRLEMKLICAERNTSDQVRLYVSPSIQEPRLAFLKSFRLGCLCNHVRCHPPESFQWSASTPPSSLTLRGGFSQADAHNWIVSCLPNVPEKVPADEEIHFYFRNDQWQSKLDVQYRRGEIVFLSDNVVALSLCRDFISREATTKSIQLAMNAEVTWEATEILLHHVHPQLLDLIHRRQRTALALALQEAATDQLALDATGDADWMTAELRDIVLAAKENQPSNHQHTTVEQYQNFLLDLFASHREFLGELEVRSSHKFSLLANMLADTDVRTEAFVEQFRSDDLSTVV
ncbi:hypothetical protein DAPPUDRAFT_197260 [Daphnia pulex]|uniref:Uncharacterized protein n=1 Tax=Daphnia pulex TaxID=6669 RepID=E9GL43_DAPPU|nr:hypothetical protein DAPPUDRAFT_197260 [Daphnia pulex]|eukprot:EFX79859.1 hypothetical protein DAPPUDRAFT_197260 [Daphnia pulex]